MVEVTVVLVLLSGPAGNDITDYTTLPLIIMLEDDNLINQGSQYICHLVYI